MVRVKDILPEKVKNKRREMRRTRIIGAISALVLCIAIAIALSYWSRISIASIVIEGNTVTPTFEIEKIAEEAMSGRHFFVLPKRMVLLVPKTTIEQRILGKWPRIEKVSVRADSFTSLFIQIEERAAEYTWCGSKVDFANEVMRIRTQAVPQNMSQCYYLDSSGLAFSPAPHISGDAYFKLYGGQLSALDADENAILRHSFAPSARFTNLNRFLNALRGAKFIPSHLSLSPNGDAEVLLATAAGPLFGTKIIFNSEQDLDRALEAVRIAFTQNPQGSIDYIDVRYTNKVYLKRL